MVRQLTAVYPFESDGDLTFAELKKAVEHLTEMEVPEEARISVRQVVAAWEPAMEVVEEAEEGGTEGASVPGEPAGAGGGAGDQAAARSGRRPRGGWR